MAMDGPRGDENEWNNQVNSDEDSNSSNDAMQPKLLNIFQCDLHWKCNYMSIEATLNWVSSCSSGRFWDIILQMLNIE